MKKYRNKKPYAIFVPEAVNPDVEPGATFDVAKGADYVPGDGIDEVKPSGSSKAGKSAKSTQKDGD